MNQRRRFRIVETLGRGGFGVVYRAEMLDAGGFSKQVALKVMHYRGDQAAEIARRLRDEARVLGLIRHRAVVGVNSLIPLDEGWGVVMEYIDGVDLSTAIKNARLPVRVSLALVEEIAAALESAYNGKNHETGEPLRLVHRDIKPSNVRITRTGEAKLLDFGVARAEFTSRESEDSTEFVMGSTRYMAPERRKGRESHQGDVYALGLVLANMLTRKRFPEPPSKRDEHARYLSVVGDTVFKVLTEDAADPDLDEERRRTRMEVAQRTKRLLLEMLAFEPADRPDAGAVERACRRLHKHHDGQLLRDWADRTLPRLIDKERAANKEAAAESGESETGKILVETGAEAPATPASAGDGAAPAGRVSARRHGPGLLGYVLAFLAGAGTTLAVLAALGRLGG